MEVYVDERGYAHDDEGNSWYDGRSEGIYLPKRPPVPVRKPTDNEFQGALVAALNTGLTETEVATALDVSVETIGRWRAGTTAPHMNMRKYILADLAKLINKE